MSELNSDIDDILNERNADQTKREAEAQALERLAEAVRNEDEVVSFDCFIGTGDGEARHIHDRSDTEKHAAKHAAWVRREARLQSIIDIG